MRSSGTCARVCLALLLAAATTAAPLPGAPADDGSTTANAPPRVRGANPSTSAPQSSQTSPQDVGWTWPSWGSGSGSGSGTSTSTNSNTGSAMPSTNSNIDYPDYTRAHGASTAPLSEYPACSIQASMNEDGLICAAGSGWLALTQLFPPSLGSGSEVRPPLNPNNDLPRPLAKLPMPLPATVPPVTSDAERPTYYFMYRAILNLYSASGGNTAGLGGSSSSSSSSSRAQSLLNLALPAEWTNQKEYTLENTNSVVAGVLQQQAPFAVSYTRGDEMLVVVRGTIYSTEWQRDFQYQHMDPTETAPYKIPGNIHAGFFAVFEDLAGPLVEEEIKVRAPKKITFTGHSLGGSVAALLAFYTSMTLPETSTTELISFGAPNVGDAVFVKAFNEKVNNRHLTFSGVGSKGETYQMGDWIAQVPCGPVTTCPLLSQMSSVDLATSSPSGSRPGQQQQVQPQQQQQQQQVEDVSYDYTALGGAVPFTAADMGNSKTWAERSDVANFRYSPVASHVCSYLCFTAPSVGDDHDQCVFTLEFGSSVDMANRCAINM